jgi:hypothetical protein
MWAEFSTRDRWLCHWPGRDLTPARCRHRGRQSSRMVRSRPPCPLRFVYRASASTAQGWIDAVTRSRGLPACLSRNRPHPHTKKRPAGHSLSPTSGKRHCLAGDSLCRFLFVRRWRMRLLAHSRSSIQTRLAAGWASGCSSGQNPGSVSTSTRAASFDPSVRDSSRFRRTRLTSRCMSVTLTDEQTKNMAASLRSSTGALTSIADILDPPVAPTHPAGSDWTHAPSGFTGRRLGV